jgi:hypothetical protein
MKHTWLKSSFCSGLLSAALLALSACGPQAFVPNSVSSAQDAAGNMNIPPKVDIVLGVSMNGTMQNIYPGMQGEIAAFAQNLQNSGWDYRFVSIPLSEYHPTDANDLDISNRTSGTGYGSVAVSKYDTNYPVGTWLPPFPGADHSDPTLGILSSLFTPYFGLPALDTTHNDAHETGIGNQVEFITRSDVKQSLIRSDAVLAVITISNGDDRSGGTWPLDTSKPWVFNPSAYTQYLNQMKSASSLLKYYSIVAAPSTSCRGLGNWSGLQYRAFTNMVNGNGDCFANGTCIDLCTNPLSTALASVASNLTTVKLAFRKHYLVIGSEPNPGTIQVTRTTTAANGATSSSIVPQSGTNGWTYIGAAPSSGVYAIDSPIPMDLITTGYLIQLNGSAELTGGDSANVTYENAGTPISN